MFHSAAARHFVGCLASIALIVMPVSVGTALAADGPGLTPSSVEATLFPGEHTTVTKTVHTPVIAPKPDIYFLADSTGSMGSAISTVKSNAASVLSQIDAASSDARYGAGDYKDFPFDAYAFKNGASIPGTDDNGAAALAAIAGWSAGGGYDGPEGNLYALDRIADDVVGFRSDSTRIVVWFGDAPGHDPVCSAISGLPYDITEASVTAKLVAAKVRVVAISLTSGDYPVLGLNDNPATGLSYDYVAKCGAPGGSPGQANRIAAATGGVVLTGVGPEDITAAIMTGLQSLPATVEMHSDCTAPISTTFAPASTTVTSGSDATFTETITVANPAPGGTFTCKDWATINGVEMMDAEGATIYETKNIHVPAAYVTGGGQIVQGEKKATAKISFAGNVGSLVDGSLAGHWQVNFHDVAGTAYDGGAFHSTSITSLVFSNKACGVSPAPPDAPYNWAQWTADGKFKGEAGWSVAVEVSDFGEPGVADSIHITLYDPSHAIAYKSSTDFVANDLCAATVSVQRNLDSGNLQIHAGVK